MKTIIGIILFMQIGCAGLQGFVTGVAGNITSDTFARITEDKDCKNDKERNDSHYSRKFILVSEPSY